jgi:hypothetical protein
MDFTAGRHSEWAISPGAPFAVVTEDKRMRGKGRLPKRVAPVNPRRIRLASFMGCALALLAAMASASDFYVATNGSGTACTLAAPCSLATGIGAGSPARPGDNIYLNAGS